MNQRGDTIVEVLIALTVLAGVIASAYNLANRAAQSTQNARERNQATYVLQQQVEAIRALRDKNQDDWDEFVEEINTSGDTSTLEPFYVDLDTSTNEWVVRNASSTSAEDCKSQFDIDPSSFSGCKVVNQLYVGLVVPTIAVSGSYIDFDIRFLWDRVGVSETGQVSARLRLANIDDITVD